MVDRPFDVSVDLTGPAPDGEVRDQIAERIRQAVAAIAGARWTSVEWHARVPKTLRTVTLYRSKDAADHTDDLRFADVLVAVDAAVSAATGA